MPFYTLKEIFVNPNGGDESGTPVSSAGDVNGDGFNDLIISASYADFNGNYSGQSYVIFGAATTLPNITLALNSTTVTENGSLNLLYTLTRTGDTTNALAVNFSVSGTALNITDYRQRGASSFNGTTGTSFFAANSSTAVLTIDPINDIYFSPETDKTVEIAIASGTGYTIGTAIPLTGTILNDDGDSGDNILNGSSGNDILNGFAGNDILLCR
ncbi:integrin alpha [Chroococcus sp. FPU101]|uniref:integrin alpha n=1 Tax=Chroococcus sp. FPU101 TaxID=1974212 RepID=UPI001A907F33|nr:integrin alpha [Chroococcus sp. FPU101]GFE68385.1 hypothetical protein CFPU101_09950 [Chroococcus sp. FPU101]